MRWLILSLISTQVIAEVSGLYGKTLAQIEVRGLQQTQEYVVTRELKLRAGDTVTEANYREGLDRLRNLQLFSKVEGTLKPVDGDSSKVSLAIDLEERWTTLPVIRLVNAGGTNLFVVGAYDINVTGRYLELGGQYENLSGEHGGVVWFRNPRLLNQFIRLGGDLWYQNRNRDLYDGNGDLEGAFSQRRIRLHLFADHEFHRYFKFGGGLDYINDELSEDELSDDRQALNAANGFVFPQDQESFFLQLYSTVGRLNHDIYLVQGYQSHFEYDQAFEGFASDESLFRLNVTNLAFWRLPWQGNLGVQFKAGGTNSESLQYQYYLGAFDSIRGFSDGEIRGGGYWHGNIEYRLPSYQSPWLVLQHAFLYDLGQAAESFGELFTEQSELFSSIGTGIRLISPKVYRFNFRFDVNVPLNQDDFEVEFAFATQQFF